MSMTITLDTKLTGLLTKQAAIKGVNVEQFALDTLRSAAEINGLLTETHSAPKTNGHESAAASTKKPVPQVRRSTHGIVDLSKEREWVRQHKDEYRGQWVVLDGDRLVGHAAKAPDVTVYVEQARAEGVRSPYVKLIPLDDEPIWMMWS